MYKCTCITNYELAENAKNTCFHIYLAGYVWAYNTQPYFESMGETPTDIGKYMSWIPLVAGCIGVVLGGFISDRVVKRVGPHARLIVLVASQVSTGNIART